MKIVLAILVALPSMLCICLAGAMALFGVSAWVWAWFLIAGLLLTDNTITVTPK